MWGLIVNGRVQELTDVDPDGRFHPSLEWVACPAGVDVGYVFDGERFIKPAQVVTTDEEQRASRRAAYREESDPLYMSWQYDQTPESEDAWREKVAEIKARFPLSTDNTEGGANV